MTLPDQLPGNARHRAVVMFLAFMASLSLGIASARADNPLAAHIDEVITGPDYKHAHWGILAVDMETGATVYDRDSEKLFVPASTTKLYSVAAALDGLGADYQFKTRVSRRGEVDDEGQLNGDLILIASGDLSLGGRTDSEGRIAFKDTDHTYANGSSAAELTEPDPLAGLNDLAKQVAASGIKRVNGDVIVDDRLFEKAEGTGSGPSRLTPIMVNDNVVDILITPNGVGFPALVNTRPKSSSLRVDAQVETVEPGKEARTAITVMAPGRIIVRGQIPDGHKPLLRVYEVEDAASFARSLFIEALRRAGLTIEASPFTPNRPEALPLRENYKREHRVAMLTSPPFSESARLILKVSHNFHASTLPLLLAANQGKRTLNDGMRLVREFLGKAGVDLDSVSFNSGAGGGRGDFTTPRATVQLLRYMATRPDFAAYEAALPILGVDGTLVAAVGADSLARGRVRAKTGTLVWEDLVNDRHTVLSKALAGYVTTSRGRKLAVAMFVNGSHIQRPSETTREGQVLGRLCEIFYEDETAPNATSRRHEAAP